MSNLHIFCDQFDFSAVEGAFEGEFVSDVPHSAEIIFVSADEIKEPKHIEAEVADDEVPSGAAKEDKKITVIQHQTNVVQNGENNFNLTNNGTMNFNF